MLQIFPQRFEIDFCREQAADFRVCPKWRFAGPGFQYGIVTGISQRDCLGTVPGEYLLDLVGLQRIEIHRELAPVRHSQIRYL